MSHLSLVLSKEKKETSTSTVKVLVSCSDKYFETDLK